MARRIWTLILKEIRQFRRNRFLVLLILVAPVVEMTLIAWATSAPITDLPTVIIDLDQSAESRTLLSMLANTDTFAFEARLDSPAQAPPYIESGRAVAAIIIPIDYSERLANPEIDPPLISLILDGADTTSAREALNTTQGVIGRLNRERAAPTPGEQAVLTPIQPKLRVRYNEEMKEAVYTLPAELGQILFAVSLLLAGISIARERELGTLEQLMVTPVKRIELIVAKSVPVVGLAFVVFLSMLTMAIWVFEIPMRGSWLLLLPISFFFILIELGIGLMISAFAKTQTQGMMLALMWAVVEFFFSGYGVPVENMPEILQTLAPIFPIYHYMIIFRSILLKGVGLSAFWPHVGGALVIGLVVLSATVWVLGRQA